MKIQGGIFGWLPAAKKKPGSAVWSGWSGGETKGKKNKTQGVQTNDGGGNKEKLGGELDVKRLTAGLEKRVECEGVGGKATKRSERSKERLRRRGEIFDLFRRGTKSLKF